MGTMTQIGSVPGYLARPEGDGPWPGVVVIQEWWGLNPQIESIGDRFADAGYLAFAPDLYYGEAAAVGDSEKARKLSEKYGQSGPVDLVNAFDEMKKLTDCTGKMGSVGFCFGGLMSLTLGIARPLDAICTFYGGGMQRLFDRLNQIRSPVLAFFGDQDMSIPAGTIEEFQELLGKYKIPHEVIVYPNSGHAFFRDNDPKAYRPEAAKDAWSRLMKFFTQNLQ